MSTPRQHEKWCKSMPREFDAMMGRGPYECDCGAEGGASPLEPLTTEKRSMTWGDLPGAVRTLCGNLKPPMQPHEWDNMNISEQRDWAVKQLDISERFLNVERSNHQISINLWEEAAAVSKNLQERADYWKRRAEAAWEREENALLRLELSDRDRQIKGLTEDALRLIKQAGKSPR